MDNMPRVPSEYSPIYSHGHMIWLDTNLQQLFTANLLLEMGFYLERWQEIEEFEDEAKMLGKYIHDNLWDEKTGFLYDQYADGTLCTTKGIGAYWALFTDVLDSVQLDRMVKELDNLPHSTGNTVFLLCLPIIPSTRRMAVIGRVAYGRELITW